MLDFITQHIPCVTAFLSDPVKLSITLASFGLAVFMLSKLRQSTGQSTDRNRLLYAYAHLAFLFFPFVFFALQMTCQYMILPCDKMNLLNIIIYAVPSTAALATIAGFVVVPFIFTKSKKTREVRSGALYGFLQRQAKALGVRKPRLFVLDDAKPAAFSFSALSPTIIVSVGMLDLLGKKEAEAVILHELAHIKEGSPAFKFSAALLKMFSPLAARGFGRELGREEEMADEFTIRMQGTSRHITSAKKKIQEIK